MGGGRLGLIAPARQRRAEPSHRQSRRRGALRPPTGVDAQLGDVEVGSVTRDQGPSWATGIPAFGSSPERAAEVTSRTRVSVIPASSCDTECSGHQPGQVNQRLGQPPSASCNHRRWAPEWAADA